jgi:nucleoside-diphosphate-sugar epimerase
MKIVVTGSQGFMGGYLVSELLDAGHEVIGIDNYSKYGEVARPHDVHPNFTLLIEDLSKSNSLLAEALEGAEHLIAGAARIGGITYFHTYAYDLLADNERIMANTCDAALIAFKQGKLKKVTYISSSMVFENTTSWPSKEGDQKLIPPPTSSYGFQKLAVEYFAKAAWDQYALPFTIIRLFNCVGVGESRALSSDRIMSGNVELAMSHVVPDLVQKILKGQSPVRILGDGSQIRHFTYGSDLAHGILLSLENPLALNNDFNISTNESTTVVSLAKLIWEKVHGQDLAFNYVIDDSYPYDVQKRIPETIKARELLGFEAKTKLSDVLDEVIPWVAQAIKDGLI